MLLFLGSRMRIKSPSMPRGAATALALLTLAGCSGGANPVRDVATSLGAGPTLAPAPDFVTRSRPANLDYLPVGTSQDGRPTPARTADEIKAAEAEMDALRARNQAAGAAASKLGGTPAPEPVKVPKRLNTN
jgi:hypothetical protein